MKDIITNKPLRYVPCKKMRVTEADKWERMEARIKEINDFSGINFLFTACDEKGKSVKKLGNSECMQLKTIKSVVEMKKVEFFQTGFLSITLRRKAKSIYRMILKKENIEG